MIHFENDAITIESLEAMGFEKLRSVDVKRHWSWKKWRFTSTFTPVSSNRVEMRKGIVSFVFEMVTKPYKIHVKFGDDFVCNANHFTNKMVSQVWLGLYGRPIEDYEAHVS